MEKSTIEGRAFKEYLRSYVSKNLDDWDEYISYFVFTYNTCIHSSTGFSPFELMFDYKAELPSSLLTAYKDDTTYFSYLFDLRHNLELLQKTAKENLIALKNTRKEKYDERTNDW